MQNDYDDELQEIFASVKMTKRILTKTLATVKFNLTHSDEDASNDTFYALVQMLRRLRVENNMCIETLCEEAMQDE
jgi:hypothetical protein